MNRRFIAPLSPVVALALAFTVAIARPARAQEIRVATPMTWVTPDGSPQIRHSLAVAQMRAEQALPFQLDPPMKEVRLSSGAKTAIIITAIVVGALIIVGAIALSRPGKKLP
jgi:hypothetical protein